MNSYRRKLPGQKVEEIKIPDDPNEPIDISNDPEDAHYIFDTLESYKAFCNHVKCE